MSFREISQGKMAVTDAGVRPQRRESTESSPQSPHPEISSLCLLNTTLSVSAERFKVM